MTRTPLIAANWKMHKTVGEAEQYIQALLPRIASLQALELCLCVPFTALAACVDSTRGAPLDIYAQNMHELPQGPYTGEVSAPMLTELEVRGVVLGHSERREHYNETDVALQRKLPAALAFGLRPILCVGETAEERERHETEQKLSNQIEQDLAAIESEQLAQVVIAYEPIWAIGTGNVATVQQAQDAIAFIRAQLATRSQEAAAQTRILYGGSVRPDNAAELLALPDVDGALVGGASLEPESFAAIAAAAARAASAAE